MDASLQLDLDGGVPDTVLPTDRFHGPEDGLGAMARGHANVRRHHVVVAGEAPHRQAFHPEGPGDGQQLALQGVGAHRHGRPLHEDGKDVQDQRPGGPEDHDGEEKRGNGVGPPPAGDCPHHQPSDQHADALQEVAEGVEHGPAHIEVLVVVAAAVALMSVVVSAAVAVSTAVDLMSVVTAVAPVVLLAARNMAVAIAVTAVVAAGFMAVAVLVAVAATVLIGGGMFVVPRMVAVPMAAVPFRSAVLVPVGISMTAGPLLTVTVAIVVPVAVALMLLRVVCVGMGVAVVGAAAVGVGVGLAVVGAVGVGRAVVGAVCVAVVMGTKLVGGPP
mmetsp:Transcript_6170/g.17231  ORF Transcript_6170/g.17231 Transcript_6170/m.17231 type:complete len:331 (-) Transcript_6170:9-1001(-)